MLQATSNCGRDDGFRLQERTVSRVDVGVITDRMKRIRAKGISASVGVRDHVFGLGLGIPRAVLQTGSGSYGGVILASDARAQA